MEIRWLLFVPAMLLLFYPVDHAIDDRVRLRTFLQIEGRNWWKFPWLWIDPFRALAGGLMMRYSWVVEEPKLGPLKHIELVGTGIVVLVAVLVQAHTRRKDNVVLAPIGYLAGVTFALLPPLVATFVVVMALACMMISRLWAVFFISGAVGAIFFSYLILGKTPWMLLTAAVMAEPLIFAYLARKALLIPVRGQRSAVGFPKR